MKSDLTKSQAETRKIEEEKVEALHSFTNSINQSVKMLDREKQKLEAEKARTDDLTLHLTTEKAKNEDLTLHLTETQQNITDSKAWMVSKNKDLSEIPKFGWQYYDTKWSEDETLEFR